MVGFRKTVAGTTINNWWDNGANAIAFSRGSKGFVAINLETTTINAVIPTSLAPGSYQDILGGNSITVGANGAVQLNLPARSAVAIVTS